MAKRNRKRGSMRDRVKTKAQNRENKSGGGWFNIEDEVDYFKPEKGRNVFDILPYEVIVDNHPEVHKGMYWYQRTFWVHYGVGIENKSYICPMKTIKKKCPICEHRAELMRDPEISEKIIKDLKPKEREVYNIRHDDEIKLFNIAYHNFGKKLDEEIREGDEEYAGFADLEDGYTLEVRFSKEKLDKREFLKASRVDFKKKDDEDESILDKVQDLDKILKILSYEELEKIYWEMDEDKQKEEENEPESKPKNKKSESKKKSKTKEKTKSKKLECPKEGLTFGDDYDGYECCDDCDIREECQSALNGSEPEQEPEPEPKPKKKSKTKEKTKSKKLECPEEGLTFGDDYDGYECCDDCDIREECQSASKPEKSSKEETNENTGSEENECPYDHKFGEECNDHSDCDSCVNWEMCQDAKDQMEDAQSKKQSKKGNSSSKEKSKSKKKPKKK